MKCGACGREVSNLFSSCPICGAAIDTQHPTSGRTAADAVASVRVQVARMRDQAKAAAVGATAPQPVRVAPPALGVPSAELKARNRPVVVIDAPADIGPDPLPAAGSPGKRVREAATTQPPSGMRFRVVQTAPDEAGDHPAFDALLTDVESAWDMVVRSEHIQSNHHYLQRISCTDLVYMPDNDDMNAGAGEDGEKTGILVFGGEARLSRLMGWAMIPFLVERDVEPLQATVAAVTDAVKDAGGRLSAETVVGIVGELGLDTSDPQLQQVARIGSLGFMGAVLGHEAGHIALAHTRSPGYRDKKVDVNRNQEREADSFCASVLLTTRTPEHMALCQLLSWIPPIWLEDWSPILDPVAGKDRHRSHPYSIERLHSVFRNNSEAMAELAEAGVTWDVVLELLPLPIRALLSDEPDVFQSIRREIGRT